MARRKNYSSQILPMIGWIVTIVALFVAIVAGLVLGLAYSISNTHGKQFVRWMMNFDLKDVLNWTRTSSPSNNNHVQLGTPDIVDAK